jgi:hypothetical protein
MRPKRPPLHPQWAEWQPYGGKPSVKVSRIFISPHYSFAQCAQCAPNDRHCTHSGPNGTAAAAPTVGHTTAIWGETWRQSVEEFYYSALLIRPMRPKCVRGSRSIHIYIYIYINIYIYIYYNSTPIKRQIGTSTGQKWSATKGPYCMHSVSDGVNATI